MSSLPKLGKGSVMIYVDQECFTVKQDLLAYHSPYFADLFDPNKGEQPKDKIYYVQGRPGLFPFILQFCELQMFPLIYSEDKGFDHSAYFALLTESNRFGIQKLSEWIKEGKYNDTLESQIKIEQFTLSKSETFENFQFKNHILSVQHYPIIEDVYKCPRNIFVHHGDSKRCDKQCTNAMPETSPIFQKEHGIKMLVTTKMVKINYEALTLINEVSNCLMQEN